MDVSDITDPPKTTHTLPNGLRVLVIALPHLHTAAAQLMVRAGSRYEDDATAGVSHFVEHMLYRGSAAYPTTFALNRAIERRGGGLYAETSRDLTSFLLDSPPESLPALLEVLADAVIRPGWNEMDTERRIVLEELLEDLDEDGRLIRTDDLARGLAWNGHPLGLPIAGTRASVSAFTPELVAAHHARHYTGANCVLCVAGPFEAEAVVEAAARAFADLPAGERVTPAPAPEEVAGPAFCYVRYVESQTTLNLLVRGLAEPHPRSGAQSLMLRILDDGLSTRLYHRIVDELGLAYSVNAIPEVLEDMVLVDFSAACAHRSAGRMLEEVLGIATELRDRPPDEDELEMARQRLLWDVCASLDSPRSVVEYYTTSEIYGHTRTMRARVEQVLVATPDDVQRVAQEILCPKRWTLAAVGKLDASQQATLQRLTESGISPQK
jgi:predicted Zn-dependent peptidase